MLKSKQEIFEILRGRAVELAPRNDFLRSKVEMNTSMSYMGYYDKFDIMHVALDVAGRIGVTFNLGELNFTERTTLGHIVEMLYSRQRP